MSKPTYKILKDFKGSPDGCRVIDFKAGQIVTEGSNYSADLANVAITEKWAIKIEPKAEPGDGSTPSTVKELKAALAELKVDIPKGAKKADLELLLADANPE